MELLKPPIDYRFVGVSSFDTIMSNFDHTIEPWAEEKLKNEEVYGIYAGWNFNGRVWFDRESKKFRVAVWQHNAHIDTLEADSLQELMEVTSIKYGWD